MRTADSECGGRSPFSSRRAKTGTSVVETLEIDLRSIPAGGWARGEREGYGGPRDVTSLSLRRYPRLGAVLAGGRDGVLRD